MKPQKEILIRLEGLKKQEKYARLVGDKEVVDYVQGKIRLLKWILT